MLLLAAATGLFLLMKNKSKASTDTNTDNSSSNTTTPPAPSTLTFNSPTDYVNKTYKLAAYTEANTNISADAMEVISAIETGWGKSELCTKYNNYFGIHASSDWTGKTVAGDGGTMRVYDTPQDSFNDFAALIQGSSIYANALTDEGNAIQFITDIQNEGYTSADPAKQASYIATATSIYNSMLPQFNTLRASS